MYEHLMMEVKGQTAIVSINNPKSLNALNSATLAELNTCLADMEQSKDIRVVIVTGVGAKAFVAGADISEMVNATAAEGRDMALLAKEAFRRLERMPQATIAAVNGYALGGGCELAMSCDIRYCSENAIFGQPCGSRECRLWPAGMRLRNFAWLRWNPAAYQACRQGPRQGADFYLR